MESDGLEISTTETESFRISTKIKPASEWKPGADPRGARKIEFKVILKRKRSLVHDLRVSLVPSEDFDDQTGPQIKKRVSRYAVFTLRLQPRRPKGRFEVQFCLRGIAAGKEFRENGKVLLNVTNPFSSLSREERRSDTWVPKRQEYFDSFKEELQKEDSCPILIYGPPGIGKTTFVELCRSHLMKPSQRGNNAPPVIIIAQPERAMMDASFTEFAWRIDQAVYEGVSDYLKLLPGPFKRSNPAIEWIRSADNNQKRTPRLKDFRVPNYLEAQTCSQLDEQTLSEVEQASYRVNPHFYHAKFVWNFNKAIRSLIEGWPRKSRIPPTLIIDELHIVTAEQIGWLLNYLSPPTRLTIGLIIVLRYPLQILFSGKELKALDKEIQTIGGYNSLPLPPLLLPDIEFMLETRLPPTYFDWWNEDLINYFQVLTGGIPQVVENGLYRWVESTHISSVDMSTKMSQIVEAFRESTDLENLWHSHRALLKSSPIFLCTLAHLQALANRMSLERPEALVPKREWQQSLGKWEWDERAVALLEHIGLVEEKADCFRLTIPILALPISNEKLGEEP